MANIEKHAPGNFSWIELATTDQTAAKDFYAKIFGWSFLLALIMAVNLAMFLADAKTNFTWGMTAGFLAGLWVFCGIAIAALFEQKTARYIFINAGYQLVALTLMGAIIGAWR